MNRRKNKGRRALCAVLLGAALFAAFASARIGALKALPGSQQAAERYAGQSGRRFVQLSAFFHPGEGIGEFNILLFNQFLQNGLRSSGSGTKEIPCAYSASSDLAVQSARGAFRIPAVGVGGDFFLFHPYPLLYGSLMEIPAGNGIVVNDRAAWLLFGAVDVVGQPVLIGGAAYVVSGVIRLEEDRAGRAALGGRESMVFVPYSAMGTGVTCYEVVLPEPVKGYGEALFAGLGAEDTVNNSTRFSASAIRKAILDLPAYNMESGSAPLPYWENAARNGEMRIILWSLLLYFLLLPGAAALFLALAVSPISRLLRRLRRRVGPAFPGEKAEGDQISPAGMTPGGKEWTAP